MKLLVVTQAVDRDDENLGSFHGWLEEFSRHVSQCTVIANSVGTVDLPSNVAVYSLGKELGVGRFRRAWRYAALLWRHLYRADAVFFHMAPEFVLAASPFLLARYRPSALWYVHKSVTRKLKIAEWMVGYILTASPLSFRLPSKKVVYTGHGIDTEFFRPGRESESRRGPVRLLSVGRIAPVKNLETIILVAALLRVHWRRRWTLSIVGGPLLPRDYEYFASLKRMVERNGLGAYVVFHGPKPFREIPALYQDHDIFLSESGTGSIDKSVLEAMASGLTVLTTNEAFAGFLPPQYCIGAKDPESLAHAIKSAAGEPRPNEALRELVVQNHGLARAVAKIIETLKTPC